MAKPKNTVAAFRKLEASLPSAWRDALDEYRRRPLQSQKAKAQLVEIEQLAEGQLAAAGESQSEEAGTEGWRAILKPGVISRQVALRGGQIVDVDTVCLLNKLYSVESTVLGRLEDQFLSSIMSCDTYDSASPECTYKGTSKGYNRTPEGILTEEQFLALAFQRLQEKLSSTIDRLTMEMRVTAASRAMLRLRHAVPSWKIVLLEHFAREYPNPTRPDIWMLGTVLYLQPGYINAYMTIKGEHRKRHKAVTRAFRKQLQSFGDAEHGH